MWDEYVGPRGRGATGRGGGQGQLAWYHRILTKVTQSPAYTHKCKKHSLGTGDPQGGCKPRARRQLVVGDRSGRFNGFVDAGCRHRDGGRHTDVR